MKNKTQKTNNTTNKTPAKRLAAKRKRNPPHAKENGQESPAGEQGKPDKTLAVAENVMPKGYKFDLSEKPVEEIVKSRFVFAENGRSVEIDENTPLDELIPGIDYMQGVMKNAAFIIGDIMVFGRRKFGPQIEWAMQYTGRSMSSVYRYEQVCRAFPPSERTVALPYVHYAEVTPVVRLKDVKAAKELLKEAVGTKKTAQLTQRELNKLVKERFPKPEKKPSGKGGKAKPAKAKPEKQIAYYQPGPEETGAIDALFGEITEVNAILEANDGKVIPGGKDWASMFVMMDTPSRKGLCNALIKINQLFTRVSFKLGY